MAYPLTIPSAAPATSSYSIASDKFEEVLQTYTEEAADVLRFWFYLGKDRNWSLGDRRLSQIRAMGADYIGLRKLAHSLIHLNGLH